MDEDDYEIVDVKIHFGSRPEEQAGVDFEEVPWDTPPQSPIEKEKLKALSIAINQSLNPPMIQATPIVATPAKKKKVHTTF